MKKTILFAVFLIFFGTLKAQSSAAEAKAAYLLAEESFNNADYKKTVSYLQQCTEKLGKANSKILYLQIMAEAELAKTDPSYYDSVQKTIAFFEKGPDLADFNEQKILEIMKLKLQMKEDKDAALAAAKKKEDAKAAFASFNPANIPLASSYTQLKASGKPLFEGKAKEYDMGKIDASLKGQTMVSSKECVLDIDCKTKGLRAIYLKEDIITGYLYTSSYYSGTVGQFTKEQAMADAAQKVKELADLLGAEPAISEQSAGELKYGRFTAKDHIWQGEGKQINLQYNLYQTGKGDWAVYMRYEIKLK